MALHQGLNVVKNIQLVEWFNGLRHPTAFSDVPYHRAERIVMLAIKNGDELARAKLQSGDVIVFHVLDRTLFFVRTGNTVSQDGTILRCPNLVRRLYVIGDFIETPFETMSLDNITFTDAKEGPKAIARAIAGACGMVIMEEHQSLMIPGLITSPDVVEQFSVYTPEEVGRIVKKMTADFEALTERLSPRGFVRTSPFMGNVSRW